MIVRAVGGSIRLASVGFATGVSSVAAGVSLAATTTGVSGAAAVVTVVVIASASRGSDR